MLKKILLALALILVVFVIVVALQPANFRVTRSATFNAPAETVFAQVNDFHKWDVWSPWAKLDPNAKNSFDGPASGVGAIMAWAGNKDVGEGRMTLTASRTNELIGIRLEFIKPFAMVNTAEFAFKPEAGKTTVTWSMTGEKNFISKAFGLFVDCDKMIGGDFEKGLAQMKSVVEARK